MDKPRFFFPQNIESFTIPNAKCPVCDSDVFYYQSPDGGRVYFDQLGPPWPKHPCTDNATTKIQLSDKAHAEFDDWQPILNVKMSLLNNGIIKISGTYKSSYKILYAKTPVIGTFNFNGLLKSGCLFARMESIGEYKISLLCGISALPINFNTTENESSLIGNRIPNLTKKAVRPKLSSVSQLDLDRLESQTSDFDTAANYLIAALSNSDKEVGYENINSVLSLLSPNLSSFMAYNLLPRGIKGPITVWITKDKTARIAPKSKTKFRPKKIRLELKVIAQKWKRHKFK